ncbi:potassium-transporting ATPase subunit C [Alkalilimnicola ehrlichii]|uniref:Potassium-transporting ATPase KdpC subunit n=1 Tax=Alkalilimnicola ehrlichii TaxID=351052 RepID=A0A3E0WZR5_9GAMM|nr:potassium-transporting ATPase subunit KdpC [Alkalilimnicola ehrlichii]RFA30167.1 potassium-transporting ATPase subunit C [Alkalilimnicola ehrlichii]RFA37516.1 potassium-transporting ATPase subunit C [Alkalilimnicola ehrlichii]
MIQQQIFSALRLIVVATLLFGLAYPLGFTLFAQTMFPHQAGGSLIERDGQVVGSRLVGQVFTQVEYFHPRPSLAGDGYDAADSDASNLGQTSAELLQLMSIRAEAFRASSGDGPVPIELVTASGSGLDPHISPAAAARQVARVAAARGLAEHEVEALVIRFTEGRTFGILGEPRVNVLELNLALDSLAADES